MHPVLARNEWLIQEVYALHKTYYDIFDHATGEMLLQSRAGWNHPGPWPINAEIRTTLGHAVARLTRGMALLRSEVTVLDELDRRVGRVLNEGAFLYTNCQIFGADGQLMFTVRRGHLPLPMVEYRILAGDNFMARSIKHWTGLINQGMLKVNQYKFEISREIAPHDPCRVLLLGAAICLDMVGGTTAVDTRTG